MNRSRFVALASAAAAPALPRAAKAQTAPIRLAVASNDTYAETIFASEAGFFSRAGLSVELTPFTNAPAMVAAVAGNSMDVAMADVIQIGNAINRGIPLGIIASGSLYDKKNPTAMLCTGKDSAIRTARDLRGRTVAVVSLGSFGAISVQEWLRTNGVEAGSVKLLEMPFAPMAAAVDRGTVAAALIGEPFLSADRGGVRPIVDTYPAVANSFYIAVSVASLDWVARNRDAARRFVRAVYDAARWANSHHDDTAAILSKYAKIDLDRVKAMNRSYFATTPPQARLIQPVLDVGLAYGVMTKAVKAADMIATV